MDVDSGIKMPKSTNMEPKSIVGRDISPLDPPPGVLWVKTVRI